MILSDPHLGGYDNLVSYLFWDFWFTFWLLDYCMLCIIFVEECFHMFFLF